MRKTTRVALLVLVLTLVFGAGQAFAATESKLESTVDPLLGIKYRYGGSTTKGFDCSGFVQYVFGKLGIDLPRSSRDQFKVGEKVTKDELRVGDLVFFNTNGKGVSHVGIYMGDGRFVHSSTSKGVTYTSLNDKYYAKRYVGARRILDDEAYHLLALAVEKAESEAEADGAQAEGTDAETEAWDAEEETAWDMEGVEIENPESDQDGMQG